MQELSRAVHQPDGPMRIGDHLFRRTLAEVPDLHRAEVHRHRLIRAARVLDLFQARAVSAIDVFGRCAASGDGQRAVFAIIGHRLAAEARRHVAVRVVGEVGDRPAFIDLGRCVVRRRQGIVDISAHVAVRDDRARAVIRERLIQKRQGRLVRRGQKPPGIVVVIGEVARIKLGIDRGDLAGRVAGVVGPADNRVAVLVIRGQAVSVDQALVALGVTREEAVRLRPLLTLANPGSDIAVARVPAGLEAQAEDLTRVLVTHSSTDEVIVKGWIANAIE